MEGEDTAPPERVGEILDDAYRLERRVALDEHAETYVALQLASEQAVFVHILRPEFALNATVARAFLNDAQHQTRGETLAVGSDEVGVPFFVRSYEGVTRSPRSTKPVKLDARASSAPELSYEGRDSRPAMPARAPEPLTSDAPELSFSSEPPMLAPLASQDLATANTVFAQKAPAPPQVPARPSSSPEVIAFSSAPSPAPAPAPQAPTKPDTRPPAPAMRSSNAPKPTSQRAAPTSGGPELSWDQVMQNMSPDPASTVSVPPARRDEEADSHRSSRRRLSREEAARAGRAARAERDSRSSRPGSRPGATEEVLGRTKPKRAVPVVPEKRASVPDAAPLATEQLQALIELRQDDDEKKRRRFILLLFLPFMFLLAGATPLLHEPELVGARALLGERLKLASSVFAASSVVVLIGMWAHSSQVQSRVFKVTSIVFTFVSALLCVRGLSILAPIGPVAGLAAGGLPYFTAGFFGLMALWAMMRGLQSMAGSAFYGIFVMLLGLLSLGASHQVLAATVLGKGGGLFETRKLVKRIAGKELATPDELDLQKLAAPGDAEVTEMKERTEVGASEDSIEQTQQELRDTRKRNQEQLGGMRKLMGSKE